MLSHAYQTPGTQKWYPLPETLIELVNREARPHTQANSMEAVNDLSRDIKSPPKRLPPGSSLERTLTYLRKEYASWRGGSLEKAAPLGKLWPSVLKPRPREMVLWHQSGICCPRSMYAPKWGRRFGLSQLNYNRQWGDPKTTPHHTHTPCSDSTPIKLPYLITWFPN